MKELKIDKSDYAKIVELIINHMESKHDVILGQFDAEFLLDDILNVIGPLIYNQGIDDVMKSVRNIGERLEEEIDARKIL